MALVIVLSLVSLALQQVGSAQQADQAPPPFRAGVELVRIPVRVLDNKGRFVPGLKRDDFRVFEDGAPQAIATFDLIEFRPADSGSPAPKGTEKTAAPGDLSPGVRTYVVLIDDYHLLPDDVAKNQVGRKDVSSRTHHD